MSDNLKRILVPIGFSEQSLKALDQGVCFAKGTGAEIVLLAVVESNSFWQKLFGKERDEDALKDDALEKLNQIIEQYKNTGIKFEPMVSRGEVHEEIARVADMISAQLVVMGTNGRPSNFNKTILGSNAYRVVCSVEEPVVTLKGDNPSNEIKSIVFPIMLERKSKEKVGECLHWARIFGAEVKIIGVTRSKDELNKLMPHVNQVEEYIAKHGVPVSKEVVNSESKSTAKAVLAFAKREEADMLIIMEDEEPSQWRVGSNSDVEQILYGAEIPVMCVTPKPSKFELGFQAI